MRSINLWSHHHGQTRKIQSGSLSTYWGQITGPNKKPSLPCIRPNTIHGWQLISRLLCEKVMSFVAVICLCLSITWAGVLATPLAADESQVSYSGFQVWTAFPASEQQRHFIANQEKNYGKKHATFSFIRRQSIQMCVSESRSGDMGLACQEHQNRLPHLARLPRRVQTSIGRWKHHLCSDHPRPSDLHQRRKSAG